MSSGTRTSHASVPPTHRLGDAFEPLPTPRRRTSSTRHPTPFSRLYYSPSNPFCTRSHTQYPRGARRLELEFEPQERTTDPRDGMGVRISTEEVMQMALMALFWAALVVFLSAVCGYGTPSVAGVKTRMVVYDRGRMADRQTAWDGVEVYRNLEGIWDAARMAR